MTNAEIEELQELDLTTLEGKKTLVKLLKPFSSGTGNYEARLKDDHGESYIPRPTDLFVENQLYTMFFHQVQHHERVNAANSNPIVLEGVLSRSGSWGHEAGHSVLGYARVAHEYVADPLKNKSTWTLREAVEAGEIIAKTLIQKESRDLNREYDGPAHVVEEVGKLIETIDETFTFPCLEQASVYAMVLLKDPYHKAIRSPNLDLNEDEQLGKMYSELVNYAWSFREKWQSPSKLTSEEIDTALGKLEQAMSIINLCTPGFEKAAGYKL